MLIRVETPSLNTVAKIWTNVAILVFYVDNYNLVSYVGKENKFYNWDFFQYWRQILDDR